MQPSADTRVALQFGPDGLSFLGKGERPFPCVGVCEDDGGVLGL